MKKDSGTGDQTDDLKCPECRAVLKRRRSRKADARKADACEMVCGGCGQIFDVCDTDTLEDIKNGSQ